MNKPIPPMTNAMWTRYWAASWGMKPGARYQVSFNDPTTIKKGMITGVFKGVTPSGELSFTKDKTEYIVDMNVNTTIKKIGGFVQ